MAISRELPRHGGAGVRPTCVHQSTASLRRSSGNLRRWVELSVHLAVGRLPRIVVRLGVGTQRELRRPIASRVALAVIPLGLTPSQSRDGDGQCEVRKIDD